VGEPGAGQVRLKIEAIGLNRHEAAYRAGVIPAKTALPSLMGFEAVGIVEAIGEGVHGINLGDRKCVLPMEQFGELGVYAEKAIVSVGNLLIAPPTLSAVEAAAVWMQYLTAFGIVEVGHAVVGDYILIPAASSSVGLATIQLANWIGAVPIALTRNSDKAKALIAHGAKHVIATRECDLVAEVMRITRGKGANIAFDPVGGRYVETLANALDEDGRIIIYGSLSGEPTIYPHWPASFKSLSLRGWILSYIWNKPYRFEAVKNLILRGLEDGHLKPVIAKTFKLDEIVDAHRYLESNQQVGKVVVTVD
jgi:NADPH:quinone reductase-like Zn-dependent oxidoreductase